MLRPTSTAELAADIAEIRKRAADEGRPLKLRASHNLFGSTVSFPCPSGLVGADGKPPLLVAVVMDRMTKVLSVDKAAAQMNVQAQMAVRDLVAAVKEAGLATPRSTLPWWAELTLAGVMSTTAHGTGFNVTHQLVGGGPGDAGSGAAAAAAVRDGGCPAAAAAVLCMLNASGRGHYLACVMLSTLNLPHTQTHPWRAPSSATTCST